MKYRISNEEVWEMIADTIQMLGRLPPYSTGNQSYGLCGVLMQVFEDGLISNRQRLEMKKQLVDKFGREGKTPYLWVMGDIRPRLRACRILAKGGDENSTR
jgi:hypothetical protein